MYSAVWGPSHPVTSVASPGICWVLFEANDVNDADTCHDNFVCQYDSYYIPNEVNDSELLHS